MLSIWGNKYRQIRQKMLPGHMARIIIMGNNVLWKERIMHNYGQLSRGRGGGSKWSCRELARRHTAHSTLGKEEQATHIHHLHLILTIVVLTKFSLFPHFPFHLKIFFSSLQYSYISCNNQPRSYPHTKKERYWGKCIPFLPVNLLTHAAWFSSSNFCFKNRTKVYKLQTDHWGCHPSSRPWTMVYDHGPRSMPDLCFPVFWQLPKCLTLIIQSHGRPSPQHLLLYSFPPCPLTAGCCKALVVRVGSKERAGWSCSISNWASFTR